MWKRSPANPHGHAKTTGAAGKLQGYLDAVILAGSYIGMTNRILHNVAYYTLLI